MHGGQILLDGKRIGWITSTADGKRIFISPRKRQDHYFRNLAGWALSKNVLNFLKSNDFAEIHLRIGLRETLISQMSDWTNYGIDIHYPPFEPQKVLPEKFFKKKWITLTQLFE